MKVWEFYTFFNIIIVGLSLVIQNPVFTTFAFINSLTIVIAFHAAEIIEPGTFEKLRLRYKQSRTECWALDVFLHLLPLLITAAMPMSFEWAPMMGIVACVAFVGWAFVVHRGLDVSKSYVKIKKESLIKIWSIIIATNLVAGFGLYMS